MYSSRERGGGGGGAQCWSLEKVLDIIMGAVKKMDFSIHGFCITNFTFGNFYRL